MRPLLTERPERHSALTPRRAEGLLKFRRIGLADIKPIYELLSRYAGERTCDYTIGGILMWVDYFHYSYAIVDDTLFIKGVSEEDASATAFAVPVGEMELDRAVALLRAYCRDRRLRLRFSAVPESRVEALRALGCDCVEPLADWSDYLYDIDDLASMAGKKYNKKRNHVNRFCNDNPEWELVELTPGLLPAVRDFYVRMHLDPDKPDTATFEQTQVMKVLDNYGAYPFEGAVLMKSPGEIAAFAVGEVIGDTLFEHIEKMDHTTAGAGETICKEFASMMKNRHPQLRYVNREEDAGDERLRYAKESLHPVDMLKKFDCSEGLSV